MQNFDLGALLGEIKAGQEKMFELLMGQTQSTSNPKIYDLVDLQEILHVSKRTIATWLKQGILPCSRVGGKTWVSESQLQAFLEQHSTDSQPHKESMDDKGRRRV